MVRASPFLFNPNAPRSQPKPGVFTGTLPSQWHIKCKLYPPPTPENHEPAQRSDGKYEQEPEKEGHLIPLQRAGNLSKRKLNQTATWSDLFYYDHPGDRGQRDQTWTELWGDRTWKVTSGVTLILAVGVDSWISKKISHVEPLLSGVNTPFMIPMLRNVKLEKDGLFLPPTSFKDRETWLLSSLLGERNHSRISQLQSPSSSAQVAHSSGCCPLAKKQSQQLNPAYQETWWILAQIFSAVPPGNAFLVTEVPLVNIKASGFGWTGVHLVL